MLKEGAEQVDRYLAEAVPQGDTAVRQKDDSAFYADQPAGVLLSAQFDGGNVHGSRRVRGASAARRFQLQFFHSLVLGQLASGFKYVSPLKTSGRKHCMGSVKRDAAGCVLQVCQAASRAYIMRLVRDHAGEHQRLAKMHRDTIAPIADRLADWQALGSLRRCLDRSQTEVEERQQTSKAPERNPRDTSKDAVGTLLPIVTESGMLHYPGIRPNRSGLASVELTKKLVPC